MDPTIGRTAFNLAVLFLVLSLIPLPFLDRNSAEFVVDVIALAISTLFLSIVTWDVRRQARMSELRLEKKKRSDSSS